MNKKRLVYYDIAKGIGILCIVLGHMGIKQISNLVFTFHVPLFFIISGIFLSEKLTLKEFYIKRTKQLLLPYFYTVIVMIVLEILWGIYLYGRPIISDLIDIAIRGLYASGTNDNLTLFGIKQIGAIWFLWALFWAQLITKLSLKNKHCFLNILLFFFLGYYSSKIVWLPFSIQAGATSALFVYIGYCVKQNREKLYKEKYDLLIMILGLLTILLEYKFNIKVFVVKNMFDLFPISIIGSIIISYSIIILSKYLERVTTAKKMLSYFGRNSLTILCLHIIELDFPWDLLIYRFIPNPSSLVYYLLLFGIKIIFFVISCYVINKIKQLFSYSFS